MNIGSGGRGLQRKHIIGGAAAALFFAALFFVLIGMVDDGAGKKPAPSSTTTSQSDTLIVPDLTNKTIEEATQILQAAGLRANARTVKSDAPAGTITGQFPEAKIEVEKDQVVELSVSDGSGTAPIAPPAVETSDVKTRSSSTTSDTAVTPAKTEPAKALSGLTVVLDPGHQLHGNSSLEPIGPGSAVKKAKVTQGATGISTRIPEYQFTLKLAEIIKRLLVSEGANVVLTRSTHDVDISNVQRAEIGNRAQADLVVRLHADGNNDKSVTGISTLYPDDNQWTGPIKAPSFEAAKIIQAEMVAATGRPDRGAKPRTDLTGFNWSKVPTVLAEVGFLSNAAEDRLLNTEAEQDKLAGAIASGIRKYLAQSAP